MHFKSFFPKRFTLKDDKRDGGDHAKSVRLIGAVIGLFILAVIGFGAVDSLRSFIGFVIVGIGLVWLLGLIKFEIIEGEKTRFNQVLLGVIWLVGLFLIFA